MERYINYGCTDPTQATAGLVIVHVSMQDTNERYWGQQFCQLEKDISVRQTEISRPSKWTTFKAGPKYSGRTKPKWSVLFDF